MIEWMNHAFAAYMAQFFISSFHTTQNGWAREIRRCSNEVYYYNNHKKMFLFTVCEKKNCRVTLTVKLNWFFSLTARETPKAGMLGNSQTL